MNSNRTYFLILSTILLLAFAVRVIGINQSFNEDELHWAYSAEARDWLGTVPRNSPLSFYAMNAVTAILGVQTWTIRLTFILAGLATILVTAKLAKEIYGKKIAIISAGLLAINPLHILASLQAAYEGSFLALFFILSIYLLFKYTNDGEGKFCYLTGITFGFALLSKTSAILLIPQIVLIYLLITKKKLKAIIDTVKITAIGIGTFIALFAAPSILIKSPAFINAITQLLSQTEAVRTSIIPLLFQYTYALIWMSPLFILMPLYGLIAKKTDKLNLTAVVYVILFYLIIIREAAPPIERYWMILLPSLAILSARAISIIRVNKQFIITLASFLIAMLVLIASNLQQSAIFPFYPKTAYLEHFLSLNWNFLVPITGSSGPLGFYINFFSIAVIFILTAVLFLTAVSLIKIQTKHKKLSGILLSTLIGISLAYQLFFAQEYLLAQTNPNINSITQQTIEYVNANNLELPIYYFKNYALFYNFGERYLQQKSGENLTEFDYFNLSAYNWQELKKMRTKAINQPLYKELIPLSFGEDTEEKSKELFNKIRKSGGSIIFIDFPHLSPEGPLWRTFNKCKTIKTIGDKKQEITRIFDCNFVATSKKQTNITKKEILKP